ncbi:MAG: cupin domain-containing protein [Planctomycetota bacterium]|jgi:quercetin dioxygenase-like cupin family protein
MFANEKLAPAVALLAAFCVLAPGLALTGEPASTPADRASAKHLLQSFNKVEKQEYPWGWIRWLMNDKLSPGSEMTFGLVEVGAGQNNPAHIHPNCEEHLYMLSGSCKHRIGDRTLLLVAGDLLRIPRGVPHAAEVVGKVPMKAVIVYSDGNRQFVLADEDGAPKE